jgi:Tfp pilus assembly protein PilX
MFVTHPSTVNRHASLPRAQRGASVIAAIFLITALALLGAMMTRMLTLSSTESIDEWHSAQALYAAESGIDWGARHIEETNSCTGHSSTGHTVISGRSWFDIDIRCTQLDAFPLYTITSTGKAGADSANPISQRQLEVIYSPSR